jgi:hypothetical protein
MRVPHAVLLTPPKSSRPSQLLSRQQSDPVSPSAATLMDLPASVANKRLTVGLSPLDATLTKNKGRRMQWLTTILLTLTFGRSDLRTFASALFSANSVSSVPSVLNPSFSLNFQLSTVNCRPLHPVTANWLSPAPSDKIASLPTPCRQMDRANEDSP